MKKYHKTEQQEAHLQLYASMEKYGLAALAIYNPDITNQEKIKSELEKFLESSTKKEENKTEEDKEKNYRENQKIISLEEKLSQQNPSAKPFLQEDIYLIYEEDTFKQAIRTGFDPLTGAWVERLYLHAMPSGNGWKALAYYEPNRHTYTLPYEHEVGGYSTLKNYGNHERAHALGSVNEPNTEAFARDILDKAA